MRRILSLLTAFAVCLTFYGTDTHVKVRNKDANITLAGTLSLPDSQNPKAFFVLASGSGAQNRDEEVIGHRPFKVIADTLVAEGFGVLRMDDRGIGQSEGDFASAILDDFTGDALSGVAFIRERYPDAKVGILGHSQGGQVAVKAAAADKVDFIVTLAGPAWKGDSIVMSQARALAVATTGSWPNEALQRRLLDIAMSGLSDPIAKSMLFMEFAKQLGDMITVPQVQDQIYRQIDPLLSPMYKDMLLYDPADDIRAVKVPWIALNGDKDLQVLVANLKTFEELNPDVKTYVLPDHNHLFQPAFTGLPTEYPTAGKSPSDKTLEVLITAISETLQF